MTSPAPTLTAAHPHVLEFAAVHDLGRRIATYRPARTRTSSHLLKASAGLFIVTVAAGLMDPWSVVAGLLLHTCYTLVTTTETNPRLKKRRLYLFDNGLIVANARGPIRMARWDASSVRQHDLLTAGHAYPPLTSHICVFRTAAGGRFSVTDFYEEPFDWGMRIQRAVTKAHLTATIEAVAAGRKAHFGSVSITSDGIHGREGASIGWGEIAAIQVERKALYITSWASQTWLRQPVFTLKNLPVLLETANHFLATRGQPDLP